MKFQIQSVNHTVHFNLIGIHFLRENLNILRAFWVDFWRLKKSRSGKVFDGWGILRALLGFQTEEEEGKSIQIPLRHLILQRGYGGIASKSN